MLEDYRERRSRPDAGIADLLHEAFNQDGILVSTCKRAAFMHKRPADAQT
ncbi:hypothetical protein [uncultured Roseibium sp.]